MDYSDFPIVNETIEANKVPNGVIVLFDVDSLKISKYNVRKRNIDRGIEDLYASIETNGVKEPIKVKRNFEVPDGQLRLLCIRKKGDKYIPGYFVEYNDVQEEILTSLQNVFHQTEVDALDKRDAMLKLKDMGMTQKEIAASLGISEATVSNYIGETYVPEEIKEEMDVLPLRKQQAIQRTVKNVPDELQKDPEWIKKLIQVAHDKPIDEVDQMARDARQGFIPNVDYELKKQHNRPKTMRKFYVEVRFDYELKTPIIIATEREGHRNPSEFVEHAVKEYLSIGGYMD